MRFNIMSGEQPEWDDRSKILAWALSRPRPSHFLNEQPSLSRPELADIWAENVEDLCLRTRMEFTEAERNGLRERTGGASASQPIKTVRLTLDP